MKNPTIRKCRRRPAATVSHYGSAEKLHIPGTVFLVGIFFVAFRAVLLRQLEVLVRSLAAQLGARLQRHAYYSRGRRRRSLSRGGVDSNLAEDYDREAALVASQAAIGQPLGDYTFRNTDGQSFRTSKTACRESQ